jgi:N-acetylglutamate synthase-like GNAT family acetyltransferase
MRVFRVSRATPEDASALTAVAFAAKRHWGYPESWIREWIPLLTLTPEFIRDQVTFKATEGTEIIGAAAIDVQGTDASIVHLWVMPAAMGSGVGGSLFVACETAARSLGAKRLIIESDPNAEGFYRKMGATLIGKVAADVESAAVGNDFTRRFLPVLEKRLSSSG